MALDEERSDRERLGTTFPVHAERVFRRTDERLTVNVVAGVQQRAETDSVTHVPQQCREAVLCGIVDDLRPAGPIHADDSG